MADPYLHFVNQRGDRFYVDEIGDLDASAHRRVRERAGELWRQRLRHRVGRRLRMRLWGRRRAR